MGFFELLGFIIMAFVLISPIFKKIKEEGMVDVQGKQGEDKDDELYEREEIVKEFLKSLDMEIEEEKVKPPPPPPPPARGKRVSRAEARKEKFAFKGNLSSRHQKSSIEGRHLGSSIKDDGGAHLVSDRIAEVPRNKAYMLKSGKTEPNINISFSDREARRKLLLMHEVMSPPVCLRVNYKW